METSTPSWPAPSTTQIPPPPPPAGGDNYDPPTSNEQKTAVKQILLAVVGIVIALGVFAAITGNSDAADSSSPTAQTMGEWATRYGASDADTLNSDTVAMGAAASRRDLAGLKSECRTFRRHLATADSHLPTPNAAVTSALRDAYRYYGQAADACIAGDLNRSADKLGSGNAALRRATTLLSN